MRNINELAVTDLTLKRPITHAIWILGLCSVALIVWAKLAPISSAALAPGFIRMEGQRQTLQHPDRGVVEHVLINDGDYVNAGQPLITLQSSELQAVKRALTESHLLLSLEKFRHFSTFNQSAAMVIPPAIRNRATALDLAHIATLEQKVWQAEQYNHQRELALIDLKAVSLQQKLTAKELDATQVNQQLALLIVDQKAMATLSKKSFASRSQKSKLDSSVIHLQRQADQIILDIVELKLAISDIPEQKKALNHQRHSKALRRYQELNKTEPTLEKELALVEEKLKRTQIIAPISGRVSQLSVNAHGSTIEPDITLMEIIPDNGRMVVQAHVAPEDIDAISLQQSVNVRLTAFNARHHAPVPAHIVSISPDAIHTPGQKSYYLMTLAFGASAVSSNTVSPHQDLYPGMPAEAIINTGKRTLFDYMLGSLIRTTERSMRETIL